MSAPSSVAVPSRPPPRAPLVPIAVAVTAGILVDRCFRIAPSLALALFALAMIGWCFQGNRATLWLVAACFALGSVHHHQYRDVFWPDDIGSLAGPQPRLLRVRGLMLEEPELQRSVRYDPLRSMPTPDRTRGEIEVTSVADGDLWTPASGRLRLTVAGETVDIHAGDFVEATGWLSAPQEPGNPGEFDAAARARDERIRGVFSIRKTAAGLVRLAPATASSLRSVIATVRQWARGVLDARLPAPEAAVADALLLGDGSAMTRDDWNVYIRTGVIHALAISGQHLVVLAVFLWFGLRLAGVSRKRGAWIVGILLFAYAVLTGLRPPALRAAVQVAAICGAIVFRRVAHPANTLALAWLAVLLVKPTDVADTGCLLSFLCVVLLIWLIAPWFARKEIDPLDRLIAASRPAWQRLALAVGRWIAAGYLISLVLGLAVMPLTAERYQLLSPVGILIGPPVVLLTSIALITGFLLLMSALAAPVVAGAWAWATAIVLDATSRLVMWADRIPGGHLYVGDVPAWWVVGAYAGLFAFLFLPRLRVRRGRMALAGAAWLIVGCLWIGHRPNDGSLRTTFLSVGHGGCTVIEMPDQRVIVYDAGAIGGPDVAGRTIAPYLWQRHIRKIDDLILSHADLDHFNGVPALLERFRVGRVLVTPTFVDKPTPGVREAVRAIDAAEIPLRVISAGDVLSAGDVTLEVLHPPASGPAGIENYRSLAIEVRHGEHSTLLTGDLQGAGLDMVLRQPRRRLDVLQAPHHGSRTSNTPALAEWASPQVVVSNEGPPTWTTRVPAMYAEHGARYLDTHTHGAVTIISHASGVVVETFRTRERFVMPVRRQADDER